MTLIIVHGWSDGPLSQLSFEGRIEQASRAQAIAVIAHRNQKDKLGVDYIRHPTAVAVRFDPIEQPLECCAAWLPDVIEDTGVNADLLQLAGIHPEVIEVVDLLTRRPSDGDDYYRRIAEHPAARAVKLSDILHNTDPYRSRQLDPDVRARLETKYRHALDLLGGEWPDHWAEAQIGGSEFGSGRLYRDADEAFAEGDATHEST